MYRGALELSKLERAGESLVRATFCKHERGGKREMARGEKEVERRGNGKEEGGGGSMMYYAIMDGSGI